MNNEDSRKLVDDIKNGTLNDDCKIRIDNFKETIEKCTEIYLFCLIDALGYIVWRTEHDLADGRIEYPEWNKHDWYYIQSEIELAVAKTNRFGVVDPLIGGIEPSPDYNKWYKWWKKYIDGLSKEEWEMLKGAIERGDDISMYRPQGDWKDISDE